MPRLPTTTEDAATWSAVASHRDPPGRARLPRQEWTGMRIALPGTGFGPVHAAVYAGRADLAQVATSGRDPAKLASCGGTGGRGTGRRPISDRRPGAQRFDRRAWGILTVPPIGDAPHRAARSTHEPTRTHGARSERPLLTVRAV
jgi:hypothetical protein